MWCATTKFTGGGGATCYITPAEPIAGGGQARQSESAFTVAKQPKCLFHEGMDQTAFWQMGEK